MRLFTAIAIPQEQRTQIAAQIQDLSPQLGRLKWVDPANLHLTLKFIGEQPDEKLEAISDALAKVPFPGPIEIRLRGLGKFPRVLWLGIEAPESLATLARNIEDALVPLGIPAEKRPYSPHLTLARQKEGRILPPFAERGADFGTFAAAEFELIRSRLSSQGSEYTLLRKYPWT